MRPFVPSPDDIDFLGRAFVSVPLDLLERYGEWDMEPQAFILLLSILSASQLEGSTDLSTVRLAERCKMSSNDVLRYLEQLVQGGFLSIGERLDTEGTHSTYFDLRPLWRRIRQKDAGKSPYQDWRRDPVTLFEEEFGRPLSGLELDQIRQWLEEDRVPEWMIVEALREAVYANKFAFKYIDRVLFDWQKNHIRTKQELDDYRERFRTTNKSQTSSKSQSGKADASGYSQKARPTNKDDRYSAFYELFPDA